MNKHKSLIIQIFTFLVVGGVTFLIDLTVTLTLNKIFHAPAYLASSLGFLSGFFFNFPMNRKKVFRHNENDRFSMKVQIVFYIALSLFNLMTTAFMTQLIVDVGIFIGFAKFIVTGVIAVWNFFIFKFLVFSKRKHSLSENIHPIDL